MTFLFLAVVVLAGVFFWGLRGLAEKVGELRDEADTLRRAYGAYVFNRAKR